MPDLAISYDAAAIPPEAGSVFTAMIAKPFDLETMRAMFGRVLPGTA